MCVIGYITQKIVWGISFAIISTQMVLWLSLKTPLQTLTTEAVRGTVTIKSMFDS